MNDLRPVLIETGFAIYKIRLSGLQHFLYPRYALEPGQFQKAGFIFQLRGQSSCTFVSCDFHVQQYTGNLYEFRLRSDISDCTHFRFINMAIWEMFEKIPERKNV